MPVSLTTLRAYWLDCDLKVSIEQGVELPFVEAGEKLINFCNQLKSHGFRQLILSGAESQTIGSGFDSAIKEIEKLGVSVVIAPKLTANCSFCPLDPEYRELLKNAFSSLSECCKNIFWKGRQGDLQYEQHSAARDATDEDLAKAEMRLLEDALGPGRRLYYQISGNSGDQRPWLASLLNDAGPMTTVVFSQEGAGEHPFWDLIEQKDILPATPTACIVNLEKMISKGQQLFAAHSQEMGVIVKVPKIFNASEIFSCHLHCFNELFKGKKDLHRLFFKCWEERYPGLEFEWFFQRLSIIEQDQQMRCTTREPEKQRMLAESINANRALLNEWLETCQNQGFKKINFLDNILQH